EVWPIQESARLALENAQRALELQPTLAEANIAMGFYHYYVRIDLAQALVSFQTSLRSKPNDVSALNALGLVTRRLSRFDEAIDYVKAAHRIDPRNHLTARQLMTTLVLAKHYTAMEQTCRHELAIDPTFLDAMGYCSYAHILLRDDIEGALDALQS